MLVWNLPQVSVMTITNPKPFDHLKKSLQFRSHHYCGHHSGRILHIIYHWSHTNLPTVDSIHHSASLFCNNLLGTQTEKTIDQKYNIITTFKWWFLRLWYPIQPNRYRSDINVATAYWYDNIQCNPIILIIMSFWSKVHNPKLQSDQHWKKKYI